MLPVTQGRVGEWRMDLDQHDRRRGREIVRHKLFEQVAGEFREFLLELELDAGGKKGGPLQQRADHRVHAFCDQPAEPLGDARIFLGELTGLLEQKRQFAIVKIEKLTIHLSQAG